MTFTIHNGNCIDVMRSMPDNSVDSIVTDPPYELGFMGKSWDSTGIAFNVEVWAEALRVLKPGGHLLAFSGSRTYHRMAVAIEDAGFQIRDQIMWIYGSGFPKSLDVSKAIDKAAGAVKEVVGETIRGAQSESTGRYGAWGEGITPTAPSTPEAQQWAGWGTALKPAHEPIVLARKPLIGTVAANVLEFGTGGLNIDGSRVASDDGFEKAWDKPVSTNISAPGGKFISEGIQHTVDISSNRPVGGRFPANLIHDGLNQEWAKYFYCSKSNKKDRNEGVNNVVNRHPTVKPTDLMRYLVKLITPPNGTVLDPFTGSGSTGKGAVIEGFNFVGIELDPDYVTIATARIQHQLDKLLTQDATRRYLKADETNDKLF
jgi:site-specific DNA-methyltransferase (adenine-specific)